MLVVLTVSLACGPSVGDDASGDVGGSGTNGGQEPETTSSGATMTTLGTTSTSQSTTAASAAESDSADTSTSAPGTTDTSSGDPVDCDLLSVDVCQDHDECRVVIGAEVLPAGAPGEYSCSDLGIPFGCTFVSCEPFEGIVCNLEDPDLARWVFSGCIPGGWEPCPDAMCV